MASIDEKDIAQAGMTTALATIYTVPVGVRTYIKNFDICNTTVAARTATVHFVKSPASPTIDNMIVPGVSIDAKTMLQWTGLQILPAGSTIQVVADAVGVTITISGAERTL